MARARNGTSKRSFVGRMTKQQARNYSYSKGMGGGEVKGSKRTGTGSTGK